MWNYAWPILLVVGANTFYHISCKSAPGNMNPLASLTVTYIIAAVVSAILFLITSKSKNIISEFALLNWSSVALGFAIVALEFGYIYVYRAGWKISVGSLVANITVACALLLIGVLIYKETLTLKQTVGMLLCGAGLFLINK